jgi:hypothetical protein
VTANSSSTRPEATAVNVRVCDRCTRPLPALHKDEYTPTRAQLVATCGFCLCPSDDQDGRPSRTERGPSVL